MSRLKRLGAVAVQVAAIAGAPAVSAQEGETVIVTEPPEGTPAEPEAGSSRPVPTTPPKQTLGQLRVGGGLGLGFGSNLITVAVAPQVSYVFKKIVEPGVSVRYEYTNDRLIEPNAIWHTFGTSLFVRFYPIQSLFVLVEGELINTGFTQGGFSSGRRNYGNLFLGGGYLMAVGRGAFVAVSLKVNVFRNAFYPSNIPIFGVGAGYGF